MTGYDLASQIKERLTAQEVVEFYGFHPDRSGFIKCPFHQGDRHASLKVYSGNKTGWHCFGCGAGGSVIDFVMKLFDIDFRQACVRINTDFHLASRESGRLMQNGRLSWRPDAGRRKNRKPWSGRSVRRLKNTDIGGKSQNISARIRRMQRRGIFTRYMQKH